METKVKGKNHSIWVKDADWNKFRTNSRLIHSKSASERIQTYIENENAKDEGKDPSVVSNADLFERAKVDLKNSFSNANKLLNVFDESPTTRQVFRKMCDVAVQLGVPKEEGSINICLSNSDAKTIKKLYAYDPKKTNGLDEEGWELFLQLLEERLKQKKLKEIVKENRLRFLQQESESTTQ